MRDPLQPTRALLALVVLVAACGGRRGSQIVWEEPVVSTAEPVEQKGPASTGGSAATASVTRQHGAIGRWESGPCGDRQFGREWEIRGDGGWSGQDLVSPCPPGTTCIWSGIVERDGSWAALDDTRIVLTQKSQQPRQAPVDLAPPTELTLRNDGMVDELGCTWTRGAGGR